MHQIRLLTSRVMKIRTNGSSTPLITCENRIILTSGNSGSRMTPRPTTISSVIQPVENRRFAEAAVDAGFKAEAFADRIGGRQRQNAGGEQRRIEQARAEQQVGVLAERLQRQAASAASLMSRGPFDQIAPAHATMMKNAITDITMQPTITSIRDSTYSFAVMPFSTTAACR